MTLFEKIFFSLFAIGSLIFYYSVYKTYKYTKQKGYNPIDPLGEFRGLYKFIAFCSETAKTHKDKKLRNHIWAMNICFGFVFILVLLWILK
jgi:hypothetical protein